MIMATITETVLSSKNTASIVLYRRTHHVIHAQVVVRCDVDSEAELDPTHD